MRLNSYGLRDIKLTLITLTFIFDKQLKYDVKYTWTQAKIFTARI